jgi:spore maturation protein CgeB
MCERIAVINLTRMGDLLMTGPMISRLRALYPEMKIDLIAVTGFIPIVEGIGVDRVIPFDFNQITSNAVDTLNDKNGSSIVNAYSQIRELINPIIETKYHAIYNVSHTTISAIVATLMNGEVKAGLYLDINGFRRIEGKWARYFFSGNLNRDLNPFHLVDINNGFAEYDNTKTVEKAIKYDVTDEAIIRYKEIAKEYLPKESRKIVVLQLGASAIDRRWESEKFGELGRLLIENIDAKIILVGTDDELEYSEKAANIIGDDCLILTGKTDLPLLAVVLENTDLLITNDTGTMHLAQSVNTPIIDITLGNALSDETGPYGEGNIIVEPEMSCFPCSFHLDCPHHNCHNVVNAEDVCRIAIDMLNDTLPEKYYNLVAGDNVRLWKTGFDSDGFWIKKPLTRIGIKTSAIYREIFREVLKYDLADKIFNLENSVEIVINRLRMIFGEIKLDVKSFIIQELNYGKELQQLINSSIKCSHNIVNSLDDLENRISDITYNGNMIEENNKIIYKKYLSIELLKLPLHIMHFDQENLPVDGIESQAKATLEIFLRANENLNRLISVFEKVLQKWSIVEKSDDPIFTDASTGSARKGSSVNKLNGDNKNGSGKNVQSLFEKFIRPRFKQEKLTIIMPMSDYFVQDEVKSAFTRMGHKVIPVYFKEIDNVVETVLSASIEADMFFTINHFSFDENGDLERILQKIKLPYISWFVDRPAFILLDYEVKSSEFSHIYTWEEDTIDEIKSYGYESVKYLPLATDDKLFMAPKLLNDNKPVRWVANSNVLSAFDWFKKAKITNETIGLFNRAVSILVSTRMNPKSALEAAALAEGSKLESWTQREVQNFSSAVALSATSRFRKKVYDSISIENPSIYGDDGWKELIPGIELGRYINYKRELPGIYQNSIHMNATSFQMSTAVNQRVFDVPASGGTLITDNQESIYSLFDTENECLIYTDVEEIGEIISFIRKYPDKANKLTQLANRRVLKEHTYINRIQNILGDVKGNHILKMVVTQGGQ